MNAKVPKRKPKKCESAETSNPHAFLTHNKRVKRDEVGCGRDSVYQTRVQSREEGVRHCGGAERKPRKKGGGESVDRMLCSSRYGSCSAWIM